MARPFRFQPPALPERAVGRSRLLARLDGRWDHRVVTIIAGAGFGKTALLVAARARPSPPGAVDVWLACEPADESAEHLAAGLAEAMQLPRAAGAGAVVDAVWSLAPLPVCLVLDDVHEIPEGSDGAALLTRLLAELSANAHLVLASRHGIPVPIARLAAGRSLVRLEEDDLLFDAAELEAFARSRDVDAALLASTGGWPALAELTASAGADLVLAYLWEEVLDRIGDARSRLLARFSVVGGGDDEIASAVAGRPSRVDDLVGGVPLVGRTADGGAALHPLWAPALRPRLTAVERVEALEAAAAVHVEHQRLHRAVELLAEADSWERVLGVIRRAAAGAWMAPDDFARWNLLLPTGLRGRPEALLGMGIACRGRRPLDALPIFDEAAAGFRRAGDIDGEMSAISLEGLIRWWANDVEGLLALYTRVSELAAAGSSAAKSLGAVGLAAVAHIGGDSPAVHAALADISDLDAAWAGTVRWLRSVAHRREGQLQRARDELQAIAPAPPGLTDDAQNEIGLLRISWLEGDVDEVVVRMRELATAYAEAGDRYLARETMLELAAREAWLGDVEPARSRVGTARELLGDLDSPLTQFLECVAEAAIAVSEGDEAAAAARVRSHLAPADHAGQPSWYWRDRAATALAHVLVPETRDRWTDLSPVHRWGPALAEALEASRTGDLAPAAALRWPAPGLVRAHLPARWLAELTAAGAATRNPAPDGLLDQVGECVRSGLRAVAEAPVPRPVRAAARDLLAGLPVVPAARLRIGVLGPLQLWTGGELSAVPELRRQRVRELLCYLVVHRRARREAIADELWPELPDPRQSMRTTLNYLQRALQPDRRSDEPPYFVRADGPWLTLSGGDLLEVDAWQLESHLDAAESAERSTRPAAALDHYSAALARWRGEPFADVAHAGWAETERTRLRARFVVAGVRAGELLLADGRAREAAGAARAVLGADACAEAAHRLLVRTLLVEGDRPAAQRALEDCRKALATLDLVPDTMTTALADAIARDGAS